VDTPNFNDTLIKDKPQHRVMSIRNLTESAYIIRFERNGIQFTAGQHIAIGLPGDIQTREYSIYSSVNNPCLEVLIKEVDEGMISKKLHKVKENDLLKVDGPFGFFTLNEKSRDFKKFLFVATGTGISPFHSMVQSYPDLNYRILHGVRYSTEAYEKNAYAKDRYILCTSRDAKGDFHGRVTDYISHHGIDSDSLVYLCGNCDMIYDVYDLLGSAGFNTDQIKTEVYF
jgi:ferredoxin--NADP+ reductase/benzoate/toluate 1,2-dioxygenase reductase subunit